MIFNSKVNSNQKGGGGCDLFKQELAKLRLAVPRLATMCLAERGATLATSPQGADHPPAGRRDQLRVLPS